MDDGKKKQSLDLILLAALAPGLMPPLTPDKAGYERMVGLWFCRTELMAQAQWISYVGHSYALGSGDLPEALFLAVYPDEASAFEAYCRVNNAREMNRTRAKLAQERATGSHTRSMF